MRPEADVSAHSGELEAALGDAFEAYAGGALSRRALLERMGRLLAGGALAVPLLAAFDRAAASAGAPLTPPQIRKLFMLSLAEMSDRLEIQQNLWDYANAVDFREFDLLDRVFTADAQITYGDKLLSLAEAKRWLSNALNQPHVRGYYHLMGNMWIQVDGDTAQSRTRCLNPMEFLDAEGGARLWFNGIWYHWEHVRTDAGWRIKRRLVHAGESWRSFGWATPPFPADAIGPPPPPGTR